MLKKLRQKIVLTIMAFSTVILLCALAAIIAVSVNAAFSPILHEMKNAVEHGADSEIDLVIGHKNPLGGFDGRRDGGFIPIAIAITSVQGAIVDSDEDFLSMDEALRTNAVTEALKAHADQGLLSNLGVFYLRADLDGQTVLAFADASTYLSTVSSTTTGALCTFAIAFVALFILSIAVARIITRPVQRAWESQAEFVANASHELKTPLTVILANSDILRRHPEGFSDEQRKWVSGIYDEGKRMKDLVEEMLFLARSEEVTRDTETTVDDVDFSRMVRQACLTFDAVAFEANATLEEDIRDNVHVRGDETQLERLVKSLIENAVKYAGNGGTVRVTLDLKKKDRAVFSVNNTGTPIPEKDLPHVFERFWRSDQARTPDETGSFGLGLSIAKTIADGMGAGIEVTSSEQAGTTFTVNF